MSNIVNLLTTLIAISITAQFWLSSSGDFEFQLKFEKPEGTYADSSSPISKIEFNGTTYRGDSVQTLIDGDRGAVYFKVGETNIDHATLLKNVANPVSHFHQNENLGANISDVMYFSAFENAPVCVMHRNTEPVNKGSPFTTVCYFDFHEMEFTESQMITVYEKSPISKEFKNDSISLILIFDEPLENMDKDSVEEFTEGYNGKELQYDPLQCVYEVGDASVESVLNNFYYSKKKYCRQTELIDTKKVTYNLANGTKVYHNVNNYGLSRNTGVLFPVTYENYVPFEVPTFNECAKDIEDNIAKYGATGQKTDSNEVTEQERLVI